MLRNKFLQKSAHKRTNVYYFPVSLSQKSRINSPEGLSGSRVQRSSEVAGSEGSTRGKGPTSKMALNCFQNGTQPTSKMAPDSFPKWHLTHTTTGRELQFLAAPEPPKGQGKNHSISVPSLTSHIPSIQSGLHCVRYKLITNSTPIQEVENLAPLPGESCNAKICQYF